MPSPFDGSTSVVALGSRLLDLDHVSKAEQIRAAMDAIGVRSLVGYR